jgi:prepilin peptidase CpaA
VIDRFEVGELGKEILVPIALPGISAEEVLLGASAAMCAFLASYYDVRQHRIPNPLTGSALAAGLLSHYWFGGWNSMSNSLFAGLTIGGMFFVLFLAGGMGAGDVKLMVAIGSIVGFPAIQPVTLFTVLAAGCFALILAASHGELKRTLGNLCRLLAHHTKEGLRPHPILNLSNGSTLRLPFAVPVAIGCSLWLALLIRELAL